MTVQRALTIAVLMVLPAVADAQVCTLPNNLSTAPFAGSPAGSGSGTVTSGPTGGPQNYLAQLEAQTWGPAAVQTADTLGVNPDALAAIANAESGFKNVPTANGSSSATGPFQITTGTFNQYNQQNNLGFTSADITNPDAQAVVAPYILASYANTVSAQTGAPATTLQAYGAYVFGPSAGAAIASAPDSAPLSGYVSSQALANNNLTGATVGNFRSLMSGRLGSAASEPVIGA